MSTIKLQDTTPFVGIGSRQERYWKEKGFNEFYKKFRGGKAITESKVTVDTLEKLNEVYQLKGLGFGNWVTQEDRFNYFLALKIALHDLQSILQFKDQNIGLGKTVSITFGSRGKGRALAHFEPWSFIINITRYHAIATLDKGALFASSGGAGSLAHEYGHALDYYFGSFVDKRTHSAALSCGNSIARVITKEDNPGVIRELTNELINSINVDKNGAPTPYRLRLGKISGAGDYFIRRNEIFARTFEQYILYKLDKKGIQNHFLHDTKYQAAYYLKPNELKPVIPKMDKLIAAMRQLIK
jgi:hypothetical protein